MRTLLSRSFLHHMVRHIIAITMLVLTLTACFNKELPKATHTPKQTDTRRMEQLYAIKQFRLLGKAFYQSEQDSGSAVFRWSQNGQQLDFAIVHPLGYDVLNISGTPESATVTQNGKRYATDNPSAFVNENTGLSLPLDALRYWVRGLPYPKLPLETSYDEAGRLASVTQGEWRVTVLQYTTVNHLDLPSLMRIRAPHYQAKIRIHEWRIE